MGNIKDLELKVAIQKRHYSVASHAVIKALIAEKDAYNLYEESLFKLKNHKKGVNDG